MAGEDDNEQDFSFTTTTCSPPRFIGSPRLWRSPSHSLYRLHQIKVTKQEHEETSDDQKTIHLLSYVKKKDDDGNENMDVIWEDLNYEEEICSVNRRDGNVSRDFNHEMQKCEKIYGEIGVGRVACGGGKRPSMVAFVNVFKKLLLLHHTSRYWNVKK